MASPGLSQAGSQVVAAGRGGGWLAGQSGYSETGTGGREENRAGLDGASNAKMQRRTRLEGETAFMHGTPNVLLVRGAKKKC
jgi:hypothetical protein